MATPKSFDRTHGHVQRETGTDAAHVEREVIFRADGRDWRLKYNIPAHIFGRLSDAEREEARTYCEDLFRNMLFYARLGNVQNPERVCLEETLRTYMDRLYRSFVRLQFNEGNKKWLVPASIQSNVYEEN
jgi:hypothetical protein